jgi:hypothetical protein
LHALQMQSDFPSIFQASTKWRVRMWASHSLLDK